MNDAPIEFSIITPQTPVCYVCGRSVPVAIGLPVFQGISPFIACSDCLRAALVELGTYLAGMSAYTGAIPTNAIP